MLLLHLCCKKEPSPSVMFWFELALIPQFHPLICPGFLGGGKKKKKKDENARMYFKCCTLPYVFIFC